MINKSELGIKGIKSDMNGCISDSKATKGFTWSDTDDIVDGEEVYISDGLFGIDGERLIR